MVRSSLFSNLQEVLVRPRIRWIIFVLFVIWLGFTIYTPSLFGPFVFDDHIIIVDGIGRNSEAGLFELYSGWGKRAVGMLSFHLNYLIWGHDPFWFHAVNIVVHIVTSFLVMRVCYLFFLAAAGGKRLSGNSFTVASIFAGLLFLVHPIQTQAVAYIVQRLTSLAALFYCAAVIAFLEARLRLQIRVKPLVHSQERSGIGKQFRANSNVLMLFGQCLVFAILAWSTKEFAYSLPFVLLLIEISFFQKSLSKKNVVKLFVILLGIAAGVAILLKDMLESFLFAKTVTLTGDTFQWYQYAFTQFSVLLKYLRLIFLPLNQNLDHYMPIYRSFFEPATVLSAVVLACIGIGIMSLWNRSRPLSFSGIFFFTTLAIESSIFPLPDPIFEHRLYLPMFGIVLASAVGIESGYKSFKRSWLIIGCFSLLILLSILTYQRNSVWSSSLSLWEDVVAKNPFDARGYHNLSKVYEGNEQYDLAIHALEYVIAAKSYAKQEFIFLENISFFYKKLGNYERSSAYAIRAYEQVPQNVFIQNYIFQLEKEFRDLQHPSARCMVPSGH